jgi:hypothetical protein
VLWASPPCFWALLPSSDTASEISRVKEGSEKCFDIPLYSIKISAYNVFLKENVYLSGPSFETLQSQQKYGGSQKWFISERLGGMVEEDKERGPQVSYLPEQPYGKENTFNPFLSLDPNAWERQ